MTTAPKFTYRSENFFDLMECPVSFKLGPRQPIPSRFIRIDMALNALGHSVLREEWGNGAPWTKHPYFITPMSGIKAANLWWTAEDGWVFEHAALSLAEDENRAPYRRAMKSYWDIAKQLAEALHDGHVDAVETRDDTYNPIPAKSNIWFKHHHEVFTTGHRLIDPIEDYKYKSAYEILLLKESFSHWVEKSMKVGGDRLVSRRKYSDILDTLIEFGSLYGVRYRKVELAGIIAAAFAAEGFQFNAKEFDNTICRAEGLKSRKHPGRPSKKREEQLLDEPALAIRIRAVFLG